jgi:hypothetical protein
MTHLLRSHLTLAVVGLCAAVWALPRESHAGGTIKLTKKDDDRREPVKIHAGDTIEVVLACTPGTGKLWKLASDSTELLELQDPKDGEVVGEDGKALPEQPAPRITGQLEYRLFKFRVADRASAKEGKHRLKLVATRTVSNPSDPKFSVPIEVE